MPQMNEAALRGLLGLCQRAGKLQSGGDMVLAAIRSGKAREHGADDGGGINSFRAALHKEKFSSITRNAGVQASNDEG